MKIFLDLDGVMADLEGHYTTLFGHRMEDAPDRKTMWNNIHSTGDFFFDMPPIRGAVEFFDRLRTDGTYILTSCPKSRYKEVADAKKRWVRYHLSSSILVIPCMGSDTKQYYIQRPGDILIDDYGKNCREWEAAGGVAIKHEGENFDATYESLTRRLVEGRIPPVRRSNGLLPSCSM